MAFFWTIVTLVVALAIAWRYLGSYIAAVFDGRVHFLGFVERPVYRLLGTSPDAEQTWQRYAGSLVIFSGGVDRCDVRDHPAPRFAAAQPAAPRRRAAGTQFQHGYEFRDEY